jgi:hypothetical protein
VHSLRRSTISKNAGPNCTVCPVSLKDITVNWFAGIDLVTALFKNFSPV